MPMPKWDCWLEWDEWDEDDAEVMECHGAKYAAEKYADDAFSNRDMWEAGPEWDVFIRPHGVEGPPQLFHITVESVPQFSANPPRRGR